MSAVKYRLQPVLDSKDKKKKQAEEHLAETRKELARQREILLERENDVKKAVEKKEQFITDFQQKMDAGMETAKIHQGKAFLELLKQNIVAARKKVEEQNKIVHAAEKKVEAAVMKVTEATKELKVIEKHKENWAEGVKKEEEFKEEKEQEEVAQNLYQQHRRRQS